MWYAENVSSPATKILNEKTHLNSLLLENENLGDLSDTSRSTISYFLPAILFFPVTRGKM